VVGRRPGSRAAPGWREGLSRGDSRAGCVRRGWLLHSQNPLRGGGQWTQNTHYHHCVYGEESAARICGADFIKRNFVAAIKGHTELVDSHSSSRRLHAARNLITPGCSKTNQIASKNGPAQYIYTQKKLYLYIHTNKREKKRGWLSANTASIDS
jgi:hypothetical protein